jgi:hypothetical protein
MKANAQKNTHLQAAQSQAQTKACKRVFFSATKEKLFFKISSPSENKKYPTAQPDTTKTITVKLNIDNGLQTRKTEHQQPTAVLQKWRCSASYDSFVVGSSAVLRLKFSGENRHLRKAAKRWLQS